MKIIALLFSILLTLPAFAISRGEAEALLKEKNISLQALEQKGAKVLLGEVTGHISAMPFSQVAILLTEDEAILKKEIDSVDFSGAQQIGNIRSVRFQGQYVLKQDVKGVILSPR